MFRPRRRPFQRRYKVGITRLEFCSTDLAFATVVPEA